MKKKLLLLFSLILLAGCSTNLEKNSESFLSFDTYIEFTAYTKNKEEFAEYYKQTKEEFEKYHQLFDAYNNYPKLNNVKTINDNAGKKAIVVDKELYQLISDAKGYYKKTMQRNNIALAPVILEYKAIIEAYENNLDVKNPSDKVLNKLNKCTSIDNIVLNEADSSIYLKKACAKIDVGSIAKGYAADTIANKLKESGLTSGIVNAGGNVVLIGAKNDGDFSIGIADPNNPSNYRMTYAGQNINIVTSGDYQRYYIIDGTKYNHIIDPITLKPAMKNKSVTIIADNGFKAEYFSTECFILEEAEIKKLADKYNFQYIIIDKEDKVIVSEGIKDAVEIK